MGMVAISHKPVILTSFPYPIEASIGLAVTKEKKFENVESD